MQILLFGEEKWKYSSTNGEVDGGVTLPGLFEAFVETVVGGCRPGDETRDRGLTDYDLTQGAC